MTTTYGIFYNGQAGSGQAATVAHQTAQALLKHGIQTQLLTTPGIPRAIALIKQTLPQLAALIIIGGDGTLNVAMTALIQAGAHIRIGIIPMGTVNNFATRYQLPTDPEAAIELICTQPATQSVGMLVCNQRRAVVSSLTFGNLADISNEVRQSEKQRFGKLSYVYRAIRHIGHNKSLPIRYQFKHEPSHTLKTWFCLITTTKSVGGHVYSASAPGKMHISLLNNIGWRQIIPYIWFALTGNLQHSKAITQLTATSVRITSATSQAVTTRIDGDPAVKLPIELSYLADRFELIVPAAS
ncbi:diacylglycerol kinase family protein [Lactiplantibacillus paraplantarum]|uniref:diacylglycerol/lipid kinase family protein n=1 Tax=Lactiplantibacillus paraplantarum TaxID=60520 RepID=UPI000513EF0D|nr:diacylglycerol kinase family protein [Lactiplantibacillus paraplantarum]OAX75010.1 diacylglycerol kinase [Lactiplantibacillus plantarum]ALO04136.1 diacylglycerol kinase [Lactiplantibacillus paraplantarum]KGE74527.1 DeoR faimly transcriptional regulator [Lactiplantibacillus paraplantarum]MCT4457660.1 diacylglycerol kinase [Lactiplantibacillus paraplantarum]MCW1910237.1 diacylglycerol kinase family protein [Lactiplantibacillus paraplantarum]